MFLVKKDLLEYRLIPTHVSPIYNHIPRITRGSRFPVLSNSRLSYTEGMDCRQTIIRWYLMWPLQYSTFSDLLQFHFIGQFKKPHIL